MSPQVPAILREVERTQEALGGKDGLVPDMPSMSLIASVIPFERSNESPKRPAAPSPGLRVLYVSGVLAAFCVLVVAVLTLVHVRIDPTHAVLRALVTALHIPLVVVSALLYPLACWLGWVSCPQAPSFPWSEKPSARNIPVWLYGALRGSICGYFYLGATQIFSEWFALNGVSLPSDDIDMALVLGRNVLALLNMGFAVVIVLFILRARGNKETAYRSEKIKP